MEINMKRRVVLMGLLALLAIWPGTSAAANADIVVIVHKANPVSRLSRDELRPIFLANKTSWKTGKGIEALNLPESTETRQTFDTVVLGLDAEKVAQYWIDRKIRGDTRPPRKLPSSASVVRRVATTQGAIGYALSTDVDATVKVVAKIKDGKVVAP
jgi:ABC-type phosphate transport system substrate-binding protein